METKQHTPKQNNRAKNKSKRNIKYLKTNKNGNTIH